MRSAESEIKHWGDVVPGIKFSRGPLVVGLTGNFGTGKSTVSGLFRKKGAKILNADRLAHEVFRKGHLLFRKVRSLFPKGKERLGRKQIAEVVFMNPKKRRQLESLVHPYVFMRIRKELERTRERVAILEVPLLFESGFDRQCDRTVVVHSPEEKVFRRLGQIGFSKAEVRARWRAQMPLREKMRRADYRIDNSKGLAETRRQVVEVWKDLQNERSLTTHGKRQK